MISDEFRVFYPCYLLLHPDSLIYNDQGQAIRYSEVISFVAAVNDAGENALSIFTDQDLSERFTESADGMMDVACITVSGKDELVDLLENAKINFKYVVLDPKAPVGWSNRIWPIEYALKQIENDEGLR